MIANLPPRQRLLAIIVGVGVVLLVLDRAVIDPLLNTWRAHAAEIVKLETSVREGRGLIARQAQLERNWAEMQANALPKDPAQSEQDVLSAFDRWAQANRIEIGSIRPQWKRGSDRASADRYSVLECRVDATGNLGALTRFLYELERSPLALRVESLEMSSRDDNGGKITLGLVVSGLRLTPLERKR